MDICVAQQGERTQHCSEPKNATASSKAPLDQSPSAMVQDTTRDTHCGSLKCMPDLAAHEGNLS